MIRKLSIGLIVILAVALVMPLPAQQPDQGDNPELWQGTNPRLNGQRPGQPGHGMRPGMGPGMRPGMGPQGGEGDGPGMPGMPPQMGGMHRGPMSPEMEKEMNRRNSVMAMAEAHKNLSFIYEKQGKIDEAAAELKKILTLISNEPAPVDEPEGGKRRLTGKLVPVYHEIARLYLQNSRTEDAEKIINEGIARFTDDDPAAASRLLLHLGEIYKNSNNLDKAAENYKRIIEMNQKVLDQK